MPNSAASSALMMQVRGSGVGAASVVTLSSGSDSANSLVRSIFMGGSPHEHGVLLHLEEEGAGFAQFVSVDLDDAWRAEAHSELLHAVVVHVSATFAALLGGEHPFDPVVPHHVAKRVEPPRER